ncbi:transcriptional regulator [Pseudomonas sp. SZ57]|uniref:Pyocin activator protein PrtN n=41 Tax=Pseudomonas TaxID=286 RepID=A0AAQ1RC12_PSESX|nr:transcriptional regulator PrtN, putative [Pseudomonas syringae pv. syringae B728a]AKF48208.1 Pyocin activator protein PrtN [Pseudomonas syringae pv. syringae B301D]AKF53437.1 Pyocin activator protein PrtN [Pseudomonas syringae pv. syringae HS191]ARA83209.1 transcriptional regulator [Pseudomonas amygdali pv. lachrymans]AVB27926.1 transcriptional regulator [Pseudomonas syringae pv. syringae]AVX25940.1 transcriptional regulator [Pseudomonas syringae pv. atrofaciens]AXH54281.1 transcriptional 
MQTTGSHGMNEILDQLRKEFATPCPSLSAVRERYFSHLSNDRNLLRKINAGRIDLKVSRTGGSRQGHPFVYLHDLANYLSAIVTNRAA